MESISSSLPVSLVDLEKAVEWVHLHRFYRVGLQIADKDLSIAPLLLNALEAISVRALKKKDDKHNKRFLFFILGDRTYGQSCVDEVAGEHYGAEAIVFFGHFSHSGPSRIPSFFIYEESTEMRGEKGEDAIRGVEKLFEAGEHLRIFESEISGDTEHFGFRSLKSLVITYDSSLKNLLSRENMAKIIRSAESAKVGRCIIAANCESRSPPHEAFAKEMETKVGRWQHLQVHPAGRFPSALLMSTPLLASGVLRAQAARCLSGVIAPEQEAVVSPESPRLPARLPIESRRSFLSSSSLLGRKLISLSRREHNGRRVFERTSLDLAELVDPQQGRVLHLADGPDSQYTQRIMRRFGGSKGSVLICDVNELPPLESLSPGGMSRRPVPRLESCSNHPLLFKRFGMVETLKGMENIGVLYAAVDLPRLKELHDRLMVLLEAAGKQPFSFCVGRLDPAKLANFPEIDAFCLLTGPEDFNFDRDYLAEFPAPLVTPFEVEISLGVRPWDGRSYLTDVDEILETALPLHRALEAINNPEDSPISTKGKPRKAPWSSKELEIKEEAPKEKEKEDSRKKGFEELMASIVPYASRGYSGLSCDEIVQEIPPATLEPGLAGIPARYTTEPLLRKY